jgi:hypothetical protein
MTKGSGTYRLRGHQGWQIARSQAFNIDAGAGATTDEILFSNLPYDIEIQSVQAVYQEATDTAGATTANFKLGTTAGGVELVGITAYEVSKAVGATTTATLTLANVAAGSAVFVRHTARAATESGTAVIQVVYRIII